MKTNMYWEKIKFYNNTFPVANPTENKQHIQGIQILSNWDLYLYRDLLRWILYPRTFKVIIAGTNVPSYPATVSIIIPNFTTVSTYPVIIISNCFFGWFFFYLIFLDVVFLFYFFLRMMVDHQIVNFFPPEVPILVGQVLFSGLFYWHV